MVKKVKEDGAVAVSEQKDNSDDADENSKNDQDQALKLKERKRRTVFVGNVPVATTAK